MTPRQSLRGKVAVVTGAGSGIGRALAAELARRGMRLALADVHEQRLTETAAEIKSLGVDVYAEILDVRNLDAWGVFGGNVVEHFGVVHQLYSNAGIGRSAPFLTAEDAAFDQIIDINMWGVIRGTRALLPHLIASGDGHVVTVSSLNGIMGYSGLTAYCTSKFAVRGFTEALRVEMLTAGHPVRASVVHPGGVRTNISADALRAAEAAGQLTQEQARKANAYEAKYLKMPPEKAAKTIVDAVAKGKSRILVGPETRLIDALVRLLPSHYPRIVAAVQKKEAK